MTRANSLCRALFATVGACAVFAPHALAHEASSTVLDDLADTVLETPEAPSGVTVYEPAFFARFNPTTARDMVSRVPGFSIDGGDNRRGFNGTGANVLIDGERPSTKDGIGNTLSRIPAASVARIELIVGAAPGIEMRGRARVANVILLAGENEAQSAWNASLTHFGDGRVVPRGEITTSVSRDRFDFNGGVEISGSASRTDVSRARFGPDGSFEAIRIQPEQDRYTEVSPSGSMVFRANDTNVLRANAAFAYSQFREVQPTLTYSNPDGIGDPDAIAFGDFEQDEVEWSLGGDWERVLSANWTAKLLGLTESETSESTYILDEFNADAVFQSSLNQVTDRTSSESILALVLTRTRQNGGAFEFGVEGAYNVLDRELVITEQEAGVTSPISLPVSDTKVEERRAEAFASAVTPFSQAVSLETGLRWEVSEITQTGGGGLTRTLDFPKPSAILTWIKTPEDQWRFTLERDVRQLNFSDFATSNSVLDDTVSLGNVELEPERSWNLRFSRERRFGAEGSFSVTAFHDLVQEVADVAPITVDGTTFDAPSNIGDGRRWGGFVELVTPLDRLGIGGALFEVSVSGRNSTVEDPVTGEDRRFNNQTEWSYYTEFRQYLPARGFAWGWDYFQPGPRTSFRRTETQESTQSGGDFDVFVETTRVPGVVLRAGVDGLLQQENERNRQFFTPDRAVDVADGSELRLRQSPATVFISARGTF